MLNLIRLLTLTAFTLLLAACSAHPGAGAWQTTGEANPEFIKEFTRLSVGYEGRTDIFGNEEVKKGPDDATNGAIRRCFWNGIDAQTIAMNCVQAANAEVEESYQLRVDPSSGIADLIADEKVVGRFKRDLPPVE